MSSKSPSPGRFIAGLALGAALGAIFLMPVAILTLSYLFHTLRNGEMYAFAVVYIGGAALGLLGLWRSRAGAGFGSGLVVGCAAGLLGLAVLCNAITSGLGNMR